ncbi:SAM-dependent methyltransferase [Dactylosporangium darangshiense]
MDRPEWASGGIDIDRPSAARVYDYWLGGSHNFAVDRELARQVTAVVPDTALIMQANRAFLHRAVNYLVGAGIRQFLDIGSGIPTLGNVHEVAQNAAPDARVVYVDVDPVAVAHSRHILSGNDRAVAIQEDLRRPEQILAHPDVTGLLDFRKPIGLLLLAVLHFVPDHDDPAGILARFVDALAPGSYLTISHGTADRISDEAVRHSLELFQRTPTPFVSRSRTDVLRLLAGSELVEPGLVWTPLWRPEHPDDLDDHPERSAAYAGMGRIV